MVKSGEKDVFNLIQGKLKSFIYKLFLQKRKEKMMGL